jgi:uncharacterized membrane protein
MTYLENMATGFSWFIGPLFAILVFYALVTLINRVVERYDEQRSDPHTQMAERILNELKNYGETERE